MNHALSPIASLHYLTQDLENRSHAEQAQLACEGGVRWVQLRAKGLAEDEWLAVARAVRRVCTFYQATFIVNDNIAVADGSRADGVHLGLQDESPDMARRILGMGSIIGATANTGREIALQLQRGADYIGLGPFRHTKTKEKLSPVLGVEGYRRLVREYPRLPLIAIGGIREPDVEALLSRGVHGIAVASAINMHSDPKTAAAGFVRAVKELSLTGVSKN